MIVVLTDPGVGGTFLTWSLHFLAGHKMIFSAREKSFTPLTQSPLTTINAHNFLPNQPTTFDKFVYNIDCLTTTSAVGFHTLYFHNLNDCNRTYTGTTACAVDKAKSISDKIIYLSLDKKNALYHCKYNQRSLITNKATGELYKNFNEQHNDFIKQYFNKDKQNWDNIGLSGIWDYREFLALSIRPFDIVKMTDTVNFDFDHHYIDTFEMYNHFDYTVNALFEYLELDIDDSRKDAWLSVYRQWQRLHHNRLHFVCYFDHIIDCIINGNYFDLSRLDLDIMQEAAIQHVLMYRHNLSFKTWQLEKFTDTQQLHNLLESNIHTLTSDTSS